jgi:hypothetical protein
MVESGNRRTVRRMMGHKDLAKRVLNNVSKNFEDTLKTAMKGLCAWFKIPQHSNNNFKSN